MSNIEQAYKKGFCLKLRQMKVAETEEELQAVYEKLRAERELEEAAQHIRERRDPTWWRSAAPLLGLGALGGAGLTGLTGGGTKDLLFNLLRGSAIGAVSGTSRHVLRELAAHARKQRLMADARHVARNPGLRRRLLFS